MHESPSTPSKHNLLPQAPWQDEPFRRLVDSIRDYAIFLVEPDGRIASWNAGAERLKGYTADEIVGRHISVFYPQAAIDKHWPEHELATAARLGRFEDEGWRVRKDGSLFWANVIVSAIHDDEGRVVGFAKVTRDLTERRQNEERLRQSEERTRLVIASVRDYAIFMLDPSGHIVSWNEGAERLKGYAAADVIGKHFSIFYPSEALQQGWPAHELEEAARVGRFEDEGWRLRKDGTRFWANVVITALRGSGGELRGYTKITRDLTERREHELKLRHSEERFRLLLEGIEDYAVCMLDPEGIITSWNSGAERMTGYTPAEIMGLSFERFYAPEDAGEGRASQELRETMLHRRSEQRGWRLRKDGTRFWADVSLTALHDEEGRLRGFAQVMRDLSDKKRLEALEEQGRHLTEFLAMLAHELRNPLAPIRNALAIMTATGPLPSQVAWSRDVIERQTLHLTRLVDDLLDVSRITRGKLRMRTAPMDLANAVQRAVESSRPLIDVRGHELRVRLPAAPIPVHADMMRIAQVIMNLLNNAAKYTPEHGRIEVEAGIDGDDCFVRVTDNGVGIAPHALDNVFDLFAQGERTLDRSEGGLGIGLTLARRIVNLHGGSIQAKSAGPGTGAQFEVRLPRLDADVTETQLQPAPDPQSRVPARAHRILVVDDNVDAATSMAMLLRMRGHEVAIDHDGAAAIARSEQSMPEVVLLDIGLPGLDGWQVAERLRALPAGKDLRIYAMTGYGQEEDRRRSLASGFDGHLVKPVMPSELFALIDREPELPGA